MIITKLLRDFGILFSYEIDGSCKMIKDTVVDMEALRKVSNNVMAL